MKRTLLYAMSALLLMGAAASCNTDFSPSDELNGAQLLSTESGIQYVVNGAYSTLKDQVEFLGYPDGNSYVRHYFQMAEFPSDNVCLSGRTTDVLFEATCYKTNDGLKNVGTLWMLSYKAIYTVNSVIDQVADGQSSMSDQLKGECYFLRALMHLNLVTLYAKPYAQGRENPGIILRTKAGGETATSRATVGQCYDQIVDDLKDAARLMPEKSPRGANAGYATHDAALGLLTRVYLYMGMNDEAINAYNELLNGADPASKLDADIETYYTRTTSSVETLFCTAHTALETVGQSSIASMYLNDGIGWGEVYPSTTLLNLMERYPADKRNSFIIPQYNDESRTEVSFPIPDTNGEDFRSCMNTSVTLNADGKYQFTESGSTYTVETETVNGEYTEYYVNYGGEKCPARITKQMQKRNTYPIYYMTKFSYQDGDPMLNSPVFLRWGEVILNAAEAYARKGEDGKALELVNVIRQRAGLSGSELFASATDHGYANATDIVMDERRIELCFEGFRMTDLYRNGMSMDRRYPGTQPWEVIVPTDNKIQYPIPYSEWSVSGVAQNPGY